MLPAGVSFYFPNCPFCSFLALFPFCCHLLLTCDPTTDTDLQNLVRLHPEPDPSFPLCFSFFLLHSCCGYKVRDRLSSVEQTSPGVMTHLSDMTDHKKFSDSTSMTLLYLLQLYLSALYISMYIMLGNTAAEIVLISRLWQKLLCIFNPSLHNHILKKVQ